MELQHAAVQALRHTDSRMVMKYVRSGASSGIITFNAGNSNIKVTTDVRDWKIHSMSIMAPGYSILLKADYPATCSGISAQTVRTCLYGVFQLPMTTNVQSYLLLYSLLR